MLYFLIDETLANFIKTKHLAKGKKNQKKKKMTQVQAKMTKTQSKLFIYLFIYFIYLFRKLHPLCFCTSFEKKMEVIFPWFVVSLIHEKSINPNCQDYKFKKTNVSSLNIYALLWEVQNNNN